MEAKIKQVISEYRLLNAEEIKEIQADVILPTQSELRRKALIDCFSCIDLTSLNTTDNEENISNLVEKVNSFGESFPDFPSIAALCVYPSFVGLVRELLTEGIDIASVSAGFPHAQTFMEIKIAETSLCVMEGASEIDIVLSIGKLREKKYAEIIEEIQEIKHACKDAKLKVILESGSLSLEEIQIASILSIESGADFIKTSTGKQQPAATPEAAVAMCHILAEYERINHKIAGFKAAGGIVEANDALLYYSIFKHILGKDAIEKERFRLGASRLANAILSELTGRAVPFF